MSRLICVLCLVFCCNILLAQKEDKEKEKVPFKDRLVTGGNVGLMFGNVTYIEAAPRLGYKVNRWFIPGIGLSSQFIGSRFWNYNFSIYSGSVYAQVFPIQQVFGQVELERMTIGFKWKGDFPRDFAAGNRLLVGGGFRQQMGSNAYLGLTVLWDLIDHSRPLRNGDPDPLLNTFPNPIIRAGIMIGL